MRGVLLTVAICALGPVVVPAAAQEALPSSESSVVRLGVVMDDEAPRTTPIAERIRREMRTLLEGEFDIEETDVYADWTIAGVEEALDGMLADPEIDVVLAAGIITSDVA